LVTSHGILVAGDVLTRLSVRLDETQQLLAVIVLRNQHFALERAAQHHDAPRRLPATETQAAVLAFPRLPGIGPIGVPENALDVTLDVLRELELEQVGLLPLLQRGHEGVGAETAIAAHQLRSSGPSAHRPP
jgi:hypothetical protein